MSEGKIGGRLCVRVNLGGYEHIEVEHWCEFPYQFGQGGPIKAIDIRHGLTERVAEHLREYLDDKELNNRRDAMPGQVAIYYKSGHDE